MTIIVERMGGMKLKVTSIVCQIYLYSFIVVKTCTMCFFSSQKGKKKAILLCGALRRASCVRVFVIADTNIVQVFTTIELN